MSPTNTNNNDLHFPPVILLLGPTATGKTDLAIEFAKEVPTEIISVDSAMVYRGMDIGTGKPTAAQLKEVPHHLIDIRNPNEPYSAAEFCQDAISLIAEIRKRERIPLLVGGSMLYFRALLQGLSPLPSADSIIRAELLKDAEKFGWKAMHDRLNVIDPQAALRIHPNDPQRIQRALEIHALTGKSQSALWAASESAAFEGYPTINLENNLTQSRHFHFFVILPQDRHLLHERIQKRFHVMLEQGFIDEVTKLYRDMEAGDLNIHLPALRAVGYRQVLHYLAGDCSYDEMVNRAIAATRQLAKRQMTWLRSLFKNEIMNRNEKAAMHSDSVNIENKQIHFLDLQNNHLDSLKSMVHSVT